MNDTDIRAVIANALEEVAPGSDLDDIGVPECAVRSCAGERRDIDSELAVTTAGEWRRGNPLAGGRPLGWGGCVDVLAGHRTVRTGSGDGGEVHAQFMSEVSHGRRDRHRRSVFGRRRRLLCHRGSLGRRRLFDHGGSLGGTEPGERCPDLYRHSELNQQLLDDAVLPDLDLDDAFLGLHVGDDVTPVNHVAGLHEPLHDRALIHVGAE